MGSIQKEIICRFLLKMQEIQKKSLKKHKQKKLILKLDRYFYVLIGNTE